MSAVAIFICHDCKVATKKPTDNSVNHWAVIGPMAERVFEEFKALHSGHDIKYESDAHGQYSEDDYDFDKKELIFRW